MKQRHTQSFLFLRPLLHIVSILLVYGGIIVLRGYTDLIPFVQLRIPVIDRYETMLFAVLSATLFVGLGFTQDIYALFRPTQQGYTKFVFTWMMRVALSGFVAWLGFGYVFVSGISRFIVIVASAVSLVVLLIGDVLWSRVGRQLGYKLVYRLLLTSESPVLTERLVEEFADHTEYVVSAVPIQEVMLQHDTWDGCVVVGSLDAAVLTELNEYCRLAGKDFYQLAEGHFFEDSFGVPMTIGPLVVTSWRSSPLSGWRRVVKRGYDVAGSLFLLIVLSPLLLCIALAIKIDSPGPILYLQTRIGKNKQPFMFVKFRSMWTHLSTGESYGGSSAEHMYEQLIASEANVRAGILPKIADDPRITRIGKLLRATSLDELPSLRSVLMGDMSLVGPRPHLPREVAQYADWHQRLFSVKPGITGYAQLYGRDKVPFDEEAKLDLWYIQHWSLWLDLYVLISTIKVIFGGK